MLKLGGLRDTLVAKGVRGAAQGVEHVGRSGEGVLKGLADKASGRTGKHGTGVLSHFYRVEHKVNKAKAALSGRPLSGVNSLRTGARVAEPSTRGFSPWLSSAHAAA